MGSLLYTILSLSRTATSSRLGGSDGYLDGRVMVRASDCSRTYEFFLDRSRLTTKSGRISYGKALFTLELSLQISNYSFPGPYVNIVRILEPVSLPLHLLLHSIYPTSERLAIPFGQNCTARQ